MSLRRLGFTRPEPLSEAPQAVPSSTTRDGTKVKHYMAIKWTSDTTNSRDIRPLRIKILGNRKRTGRRVRGHAAAGPRGLAAPGPRRRGDPPRPLPQREGRRKSTRTANAERSTKHQQMSATKNKVADASRRKQRHHV